MFIVKCDRFGLVLREKLAKGINEDGKFSMNRRYTVHKPRNELSSDFVIWGGASLSDFVFVSWIFKILGLIRLSKYSTLSLKNEHLLTFTAMFASLRVVIISST